MKIFSIFFFLLLTLPLVGLANGGDQRVVDGKYLINLSRSPFTPRVGVETSMIASFVDIEKDKFIAEDLIVKVRIARLSGAGKREFLLEKDNLIVQGGVLELAHTFTEIGLHEIFFDFASVLDPTIVYKAPDFLLDVQSPSMPQKSNKSFLIGAGLGIVSAFLIGLFAGRKIKTAI